MLSLVLMTSCKKDNETKITGTWDLETVTTKYYESGALVDTEVESGVGTTLNFKSDGELVITTPIGTQSFDYTVDGDEITIDGETAEIRTLTSSSLVIYSKEVWGGPGDYDEITMELSK